MTTETKSIQKTTTQTLHELLAQRKDSIAQLVPKHLSAERLMRVAVNCVAKTPGLQDCSPTSLLQCVLVAAELGLEPGGALGHLYLVPFKGKATPVVGYRGFLELARRTGQVSKVRAVVVYEKEVFRVIEGLHFDIVHERSLAEDRGQLKHVYAVAELADGSVQFEVMTRQQVEAIRARSLAGKSGPWATDFEEMAKKTVFRRLAKWLPLSSERFDKALEIDNDDYVDGEVAESSAAIAATASEGVKAKVRRLLIEDAAPPQVAAETPAPVADAPFVAEVAP